MTRPTHRSGAVYQVWFLSDCEPPARIKYVIFVPGLEVWQFETRLEAEPSGGTRATVTHQMTSLSAEANAAVQEFADGLDACVKRWRRAMESAAQDNWHLHDDT